MVTMRLILLVFVKLVARAERLAQSRVHRDGLGAGEKNANFH